MVSRGHPRTGLSAAAALAVMLAAITALPIVLYFVAVDRGADASPLFILTAYVVIGALLVAIFLPAVLMAVLHTSSVRSLVTATAVVLLCLGGAHTIVLWTGDSAEVPLFLLYPIAGLAAALGAWGIAVAED